MGWGDYNKFNKKKDLQEYNIFLFNYFKDTKFFDWLKKNLYLDINFYIKDLFIWQRYLTLNFILIFSLRIIILFTVI